MAKTQRNRKPGATGPGSVEQEIGVREAAVLEIPIETIDLEDREFCFRIDLDLGNLKADIEKRGQQFPVVLREKGPGEGYQIISGFRRCTALKELHVPHAKALVRALTDDEAYYVSFIENEKRRNLTSLDKAHAIAKLAERGKTAKEIQALYGIGERQYYRLKKVSEFPGEIKDALADKFIQVTHALVLMEAFESYGPRVELDDWIDWILDRRASVRDLKRHLRKRYGKQQPCLVERQAGGFRLRSASFDPTKTSGEDAQRLLSDIEEAAEIIRRWLGGM